ncbi:MAG: hypothetical protein JJ966_09760 [Balneolaceae bacterium]|nr:hypothetical protein [Balneolaceae bacterium]
MIRLFTIALLLLILFPRKGVAQVDTLIFQQVHYSFEFQDSSKNFEVNMNGGIELFFDISAVRLFIPIKALEKHFDVKLVDPISSPADYFIFFGFLRDENSFFRYQKDHWFIDKKRHNINLNGIIGNIPNYNIPQKAELNLVKLEDDLYFRMNIRLELKKFEQGIIQPIPDSLNNEIALFITSQTKWDSQ